MSLFKKRNKHHHSWIMVDQRVVSAEYVRSGLFIKPTEFVIECVARLYRCNECGSEKASVWPADGRAYVDVRDIPPGIGNIDPFYYRERFKVAATEKKDG